MLIYKLHYAVLRERQVAMMKESMCEIPKSQRPYEKCLREGTEALSDIELLAVILRSGTKGNSSLSVASQILKVTEQSPYPGLPGLMHMSVKDLTAIRGVGTVKAIQLKCIGELSKRIARCAAKPQVSFQEPESIARYYMEQLRHEEQEHLYCMFLDGANHLLGEKLLSRGTVNATLITPREIFVEALRNHAVNFILVHNHPGGNPTPSQGDMEVTRRIYEAGELLGIHLLDHIVIGDQRFVSFYAQGILGEYSG